MKLTKMKQGYIEIFVYEENCCDDTFEIMNSNGFSLETLISINNSLKDDDFSKYYGKTLTIRPQWINSQIGDYPPPNIECKGYWDISNLTVL